MNISSNKILIIQEPLGEAPMWVRKAWIGLELPLLGKNLFKTYKVTGVLSAPKSISRGIWDWLCGNFERMPGYLVDANNAVLILAESNPEAAAWWRENASYSVKPGRQFIFNKDACSLILKNE